MNSKAAPWIITCLVLVVCMVLVIGLWKRERATAAYAQASAEKHHNAMLQHLAAADSLLVQKMARDTAYAKAMREFGELAASLEDIQFQADANQAAIHAAPADSLPSIVRRLLSTARHLGYIRPGE